MSLLIYHLELVGLRINLNRELSFLNLGANHAVLHQLDRQSFALRIEDFHLLVGLAYVAEHMITNVVQEMTNVA